MSVGSGLGVEGWERVSRIALNWALLIRITVRCAILMTTSKCTAGARKELKRSFCD